MKSPPGPLNPRYNTRLRGPATTRLSEPFQVEWRCKKHIDNRLLASIRRRSNNQPATQTDDGGVIDDYAGRRMVEAMDSLPQN